MCAICDIQNMDNNVYHRDYYLIGLFWTGFFHQQIELKYCPGEKKCL